MATYGLTTYKEDGTTVVLSNSTKSGVYGKSVLVSKSGTAGTITTLDFPEYTGRNIRPMQLNPGAHNWTLSYVSGVPRITFVEGSGISSAITAFYYSDTVLYIFVR